MGSRYPSVARPGSRGGGGAPRRGRPADDASGRLGQREFVVVVGRDDRIAQGVLRGGVVDRAQQREAAALAVDRVLPRREGYVAAAGLALPDREADQLETAERAAD